MKYFGNIGFWEDDVETAPGVYESKIVQRPYAGDVIDSRQRWNNDGHQNDNLTINNKISIIADLYFNQHMGSIKYVEFMGTKWKVSSLDIKYPRVILDLGEVYNGVDAGETD
jgi:hypothetical protein